MSEELKHTPGPWYLSERRIGILGHDKNGYAHVPVATTSPQNSEEIRMADARLIAAAPEMYQLLHDVSNCVAKNVIWDDLLVVSAKASDLLQKIEGGDAA